MKNDEQISKNFGKKLNVDEENSVFGGKINLNKTVALGLGLMTFGSSTIPASAMSADSSKVKTGVNLQSKISSGLDGIKNGAKNIAKKFGSLSTPAKAGTVAGGVTLLATAGLGIKSLMNGKDSKKNKAEESDNLEDSFHKAFGLWKRMSKLGVVADSNDPIAAFFSRSSGGKSEELLFNEFKSNKGLNNKDLLNGFIEKYKKRVQEEEQKRLVTHRDAGKSGTSSMASETKPADIAHENIVKEKNQEDEEKTEEQQETQNEPQKKEDQGLESSKDGSQKEPKKAEEIEVEKTTKAMENKKKCYEKMKKLCLIEGQVCKKYGNGLNLKAQFESFTYGGGQYFNDEEEPIIGEFDRRIRSNQKSLMETEIGREIQNDLFEDLKHGNTLRKDSDSNLVTFNDDVEVEEFINGIEGLIWDAGHILNFFVSMEKKKECLAKFSHVECKIRDLEKYSNCPLDSSVDSEFRAFQFTKFPEEIRKLFIEINDIYSDLVYSSIGENVKENIMINSSPFIAGTHNHVSTSGWIIFNDGEGIDEFTNKLAHLDEKCDKLLPKLVDYEEKAVENAKKCCDKLKELIGGNLKQIFISPIWNVRFAELESDSSILKFFVDESNCKDDFPEEVKRYYNEIHNLLKPIAESTISQKMKNNVFFFDDEEERFKDLKEQLLRYKENQHVFTDAETVDFLEKNDILIKKCGELLPKISELYQKLKEEKAKKSVENKKICVDKYKTLINKEKILIGRLAPNFYKKHYDCLIPESDVTNFFAKKSKCEVNFSDEINGLYEEICDKQKTLIESKIGGILHYCENYLYQLLNNQNYQADFLDDKKIEEFTTEVDDLITKYDELIQKIKEYH